MEFDVDMVRALGFSDNAFDPRDPGRLCRGRERWIEPWDLETAVPTLRRIVVSGATFSDDGAGDARRGLTSSGLDLGEIVQALYPDAPLVAFMEDGHPADIPAAALGVEAYEGYRAGGRQELGLVRWYLPLSGVAELGELLDGAPDPSAKGAKPDWISPEDRLRGLLVLDEPIDDLSEVMEQAFEFVGFSTLDSPPARYQPSALPGLLRRVRAVLALHRDKHGPSVAFYANEPVPQLEERLAALCDPRDILLVPFAIPPMLARWDRALAELRAGWPAARGPFPVPVAQPSSEPRHRRRFRGAPEDDDYVEAPVEADIPVPDPVDDAEE